MSVVITIAVVVVLAAGLYSFGRLVGFGSRTLTRRSGTFGPFSDDAPPPHVDDDEQDPHVLGGARR